MKKMYAQYIKSINSLSQSLSLDKIETITNILFEAYKNNSQVFIMGNGGSASIASHFACDLGKGTAQEGKPRFRIMSLNDNMPLVTALSNDYGYSRVFKEQLMNLLNKGDVVIVISASGNSENVIKAVEYAKEQGAITIGFLGFDGGKLSKMVDANILVDSFDYGSVEIVHNLLTHMITNYFQEKLS